MKNPQAIIVMGISGSGKSSVGEALANRLGWHFFDGDDYHPKENINKMAAGIPLNDRNRGPWLTILNRLINDQLQQGESLVLACSALKSKYRSRLSEGNSVTTFVFLHGELDLIARRMQKRQGHFMRTEMLQSQVDTLEEPNDAIKVNIDQSIEKIVEQIIAQMPI